MDLISAGRAPSRSVIYGYGPADKSMPNITGVDRVYDTRKLHLQTSHTNGTAAINRRVQLCNYMCSLYSKFCFSRSGLRSRLLKRERAAGDPDLAGQVWSAGASRHTPQLGVDACTLCTHVHNDIG